MQCILLGSEGAGQIRITLPVAFRVAIGQARPAVSVSHGVATMWKRVRPGVMDRHRRLGTPGEVAILPLRIAPGTLRVPMPCLDLQFRILPVGDGLPSRSEYPF